MFHSDRLLGRGFARRLVNRCLEFVAERRVEWAGLDATDMGKPLYATLGFDDEYEVERWIRPAAPAMASVQSPEACWLDSDLDRKAFGADRSRLLRELARIELMACTGLGYAMGRPGRLGRYFGPCVSTDGDVVRSWLLCFLALHCQEAVYWDLIPGNTGALALAREFGFEKRRTLTRMSRPVATSSKPHDCRNHIYALAGFEWG